MLYEGLLNGLVQFIRGASNVAVSKQLQRRQQGVGGAEIRQHPSEHDRMRGWNILLSQVKHSLPNCSITLRQFDESAN